MKLATSTPAPSTGQAPATSSTPAATAAATAAGQNAAQAGGGAGTGDPSQGGSQQQGSPTTSILGLAPQAATTTAAPPPAAALSAPYNNAMSAAIESVRATLQLATSQGQSQARIALQPAALGDVTIHLRQTDNGVVARIVADNPQTAAALQGSSAELRRTLDGMGVNVLTLDIGTSSQQQQSTSNQGRPQSQPQQATLSPLPPAESGESQEQAIQLPDGMLVDIQA
jgi:flagellar hook-length control protein FliK